MMAVAYSVNIIGLKELQAKYSKASDSVKKQARMALQAGAATFVRNAKRDAPVDMGVLKNSITFVPISDLTYEIVSGAKYSPYLEFGTVTKVSVPAELVAYASQFKGKGLRTTGGIFPHPYFFKQLPIAKKQIEADLKFVKI